MSRLFTVSIKAFLSLSSTVWYWSIISLKTAYKKAVWADQTLLQRQSIILCKITENYLYSQYKSSFSRIVARLNAWRTSNKSTYHLRETYRNTKMLFKSIIDTFFYFKIHLTSKNLFRLINKLADIMLTPQIDTVRSSRGNFKRYRRS